MSKKLFLIGLLSLVSYSIRGQTFSSGSTGADGALDLATGSCQRQIQLPESGIFNYTTINIPTGCHLSFKPNFRNTPVIVLAQGDVYIAGTVNVSGVSSSPTPGPGGYFGGVPGQNGFGPGGGHTSDVNGSDPQRNGRWVGTLSLVPITGGSGGAGRLYVGQGGGGAIVIASSSSIVLTASSYFSADAYPSNGFPGEGSGGAIRLVSNSITASGYLLARGGNQSGNNGVIRLEAPAGALIFNGIADPPPILSTTVNPQIISNSNTPSLSITSIGGFPVSYTTGRPDSVDLILPNQVSDPINIGIQAHNIPVGTQVNLNISGPASGAFSPGTLSGTQASSSATIAVSGLSRTGLTYVVAYADFTLSGSASNINKRGPDQIAKVRVIAKPGVDSRLVFLRKNGAEIDLTKIPKGVRQQFGLD